MSQASSGRQVIVPMLPLVRSYIAQHFTLQEGSIWTHSAIPGLWLVSAAFQSFIFATMTRTGRGTSAAYTGAACSEHEARSV